MPVRAKIKINGNSVCLPVLFFQSWGANMGKTQAVFALEDGSTFEGAGFGAEGCVTGEAVFNTSMTGYQEILTDPSYFGQIVVMTTPQIGNYGVNPEDVEADRPMARGLVVRDLSPVVSNWRSTQSLDAYLRDHSIPGISGVDTRAITKRLRTAGAMRSCLAVGNISAAEAVERARQAENMEGSDFVREVTCSAPYLFDPGENGAEGFSVEGTHLSLHRRPEQIYRVAAIDFGAKRSILYKLYRHGFDVKVFPATVKAEEVKAYAPDGVFLSNGPGDPAAVTYAHGTVRELIESFPVFGICLGHQIITHAIGGKTFKLKFGHRGGNQPVKNIETGVVRITAQNHGFATDPDSLGDKAVITEINLNDQTVAGLRLKDRPTFAVQYHPEAGPGPNDADSLFHDFRLLVEKHASRS